MPEDEEIIDFKQPSREPSDEEFRQSLEAAQRAVEELQRATDAQRARAHEVMNIRFTI
jgi:hypothetical protein